MKLSSCKEDNKEFIRDIWNLESVLGDVSVDIELFAKPTALFNFFSGQYGEVDGYRMLVSIARSLFNTDDNWLTPCSVKAKGGRLTPIFIA